MKECTTAVNELVDLFFDFFIFYFVRLFHVVCVCFFFLLLSQVDLLETGSHCNVFTAALTTKNQRQDVHSTIRHKAKGTTCLQEQRNVVSDTADCVFKGRIVIDVSCLWHFPSFVYIDILYTVHIIRSSKTENARIAEVYTVRLYRHVL